MEPLLLSAEKYEQLHTFVNETVANLSSRILENEEDLVKMEKELEKLEKRLEKRCNENSKTTDKLRNDLNNSKSNKPSNDESLQKQLKTLDNQLNNIMDSINERVLKLEEKVVSSINNIPLHGTTEGYHIIRSHTNHITVSHNNITLSMNNITLKYE